MKKKKGNAFVLVGEGLVFLSLQCNCEWKNVTFTIEVLMFSCLDAARKQDPLEQDNTEAITIS